jgi:hypothetical protein
MLYGQDLTFPQQASKRAIARLEGHDDPKRIASASMFAAGGIAGMIAQAVVYPLDTLKFQMQCDTVAGGEHGNKLIFSTARKLWTRGGIPAFYRGLPMGLVGMFPYAAIDLSVFETLKKKLIARNRRLNPNLKHDEDALPGNFYLALMGGFSGAIGASAVYPVNLLRTRLQSQGTRSHPRTYTGIADVTRQTLKGEGVRGLFKGLTPNLFKVVPAVSIVSDRYEQDEAGTCADLNPTDLRCLRKHQEGIAFAVSINVRRLETSLGCTADTRRLAEHTSDVPAVGSGNDYGQNPDRIGEWACAEKMSILSFGPGSAACGAKNTWDCAYAMEQSTCDTLSNAKTSSFASLNLQRLSFY